MARFVTCGDQGASFAHVLPASLVTPGVTDLSVGWYFSTCAITGGGAVQCWGADEVGEIGNGDQTVSSSLVPVQVSGLTTGGIAVSSGLSSACAIVGSGVQCWGGTLGTATGHSYVPIAVPGLASGVTALSVGYGSACAIAQGGHVLCWGANLDGQLGDGTTTASATPVQVTGL